VGIGRILQKIPNQKDAERKWKMLAETTKGKKNNLRGLDVRVKGEMSLHTTMRVKLKRVIMPSQNHIQWGPNDL